MSPTRKSEAAATADPDRPAQAADPALSGEAAVSYEQARDELAYVVERLEAGGLSLDDSLTLWERGETLARLCQRFLDGARERVESALAAADAATGDTDGEPG